MLLPIRVERFSFTALVQQIIIYLTVFGEKRCPTLLCTHGRKPLVKLNCRCRETRCSPNQNRTTCECYNSRGRSNKMRVSESGDSLIAAATWRDKDGANWGDVRTKYTIIWICNTADVFLLFTKLCASEQVAICWWVVAGGWWRQSSCASPSTHCHGKWIARDTVSEHPARKRK